MAPWSILDTYQKLESLRSAYEEDAKVAGDRKIDFFRSVTVGGSDNFHC
jgi:hypothetical protein